MDEPVPCSKCREIPYDILMLNCNHNLCVKCAADRIQTQSLSKSPSGKSYLQCERCKIKTILDQQSIAQLQKLNQSDSEKSEKLKVPRTQTPINTGRTRNVPQDKSRQSIPQETSKPSITKSSKQGECEIHPEEPVMYYCFTCKCHCFCAECVLTGRHQDHDVKVIKKAYLIVQKEFEQFLEGTKGFVRQLQQKKKEASDNINFSKNRVDAIKRSIQKAFNEVRQTIRQKQVEFMKLVDAKFQKSLEQSNGVIQKKLEVQIHEQEQFLQKLTAISKKGQIAVLESYSSEWADFKQISKNQRIELPDKVFSIDEEILECIKRLKDQVERIKPGEQNE